MPSAQSGTIRTLGRSTASNGKVSYLLRTPVDLMFEHIRIDSKISLLAAEQKINFRQIAFTCQVRKAQARSDNHTRLLMVLVSVRETLIVVTHRECQAVFRVLWT